MKYWYWLIGFWAACLIIFVVAMEMIDHPPHCALSPEEVGELFIGDEPKARDGVQTTINLDEIMLVWNESPESGMMWQIGDGSITIGVGGEACNIDQLITIAYAAIAEVKLTDRQISTVVQCDNITKSIRDENEKEKD